jgi:hypothetical protein
MHLPMAERAAGRALATASEHRLRPRRTSADNASGGRFSQLASEQAASRPVGRRSSCTARRPALAYKHPQEKGVT